MAAPAGFLGIVMLDTRFPRPPGDVGHDATFAVPTRRHVVRGVWPATVVQSAAALRQARVLPVFAQAVRHLAQQGALAITTSCGFLVLLQQELQAVVPVPVVSSSLLLLPDVLARERQVGVLTISAERLGPEHLAGAGVPGERVADVLVQGVAAGSEFASRILGNDIRMDLAQAGRDVLAAALALQARAPQLRTVVLECTNMPPYRDAIARATGWRVLWLGDCAALFRPFGAPAAAQDQEGTIFPCP